MSKVAATEPRREQCSCGAKVTKAHRDTPRGPVVLLEETGGRMAIQLDLAGGLPVAFKSDFRAPFKYHQCPKVRG